MFRIERTRLIAGLMRLVRDVDLAEELTQDALVAALDNWPDRGIPDNPGAWLMTTARNRALDLLKRKRRTETRNAEISRDMERAERAMPEPETALDDDVGDDVLRLIFTACHPVLPPEARVALTLRLIAGLTTEEIAKAFLVPEATLAQRIVRAKRTLADKAVAYEVPHGAELSERLESVLGVVYLIFNEGYSATAGESWTRPQLCVEALRLGRILAALAPAEPEAHGLLALMELQASRLDARVDSQGKAILLPDQNRTRWDHTLIQRGLAGLARARRLGGATGPYALQAAIAACHARAPTADATDWAQIAALYTLLNAVQRSPIVELNRAVAVGMVEGPHAALEIVDALMQEPAMKRYHPCLIVRGDLLERLGRFGEAETAFSEAAGMTANRSERLVMLARAAACAARRQT